MLLPRSAFKRSAKDSGPTVQPEVVVPIRPGGGRLSPRPVFDPADMPRPRTIYPVLEPEPEPEPPPEPPGPTAEEIAQMVRDAEARGFERGKAEMEQAVRDNVEQEQRLAAVADAVVKARAQWKAETRGDVARLVLDSVAYICGELPEALQSVLALRLTEAGEQLVDARKVVVRVSPRDAELVQAKVGDRTGWEVRADPTIAGGCFVSSENGEVDGTLRAAFKALDAAAADWRAEVEATGDE